MNHKVSPQMQIYLDPDQCRKFGVDYYGSGRKITVNAQMLMDSNPNGYDAQHQRMLKPTIEVDGDLVLSQADLPGWFNIVAEIK